MNDTIEDIKKCLYDYAFESTVDNDLEALVYLHERCDIELSNELLDNAIDCESYDVTYYLLKNDILPTNHNFNECCLSENMDLFKLLVKYDKHMTIEAYEDLLEFHTENHILSQ